MAESYGLIVLTQQNEKLRNTTRKQLRDAEDQYLRRQINSVEDPKKVWLTPNEQLRGESIVEKFSLK